jgi:glycosyltransferase involved in cell wall biosynthesis
MHLGKNDIVISHLPRITHWQSVFMKKLSCNNPHLAFSFNFTKLPERYYHSAMIKSFSRVDEFVVYSNYERKLYSEYFEIPKDKIHMIHWAMDIPNTVDMNLPFNNYYCAVGGEGRDYKILLDIFKSFKNINLIIVTRPNALKDHKIPSNVKIFYNLTNEEYWGVVKKSKAVIVPLLDSNTSCGHITLVGAMKLKKAIITTFSHGTIDYVCDNKTGFVTSPQDTSSLKKAIEAIESDQELRERFAKYNYDFANKYCDPELWANYVYRFINKTDLYK